MPINWIYSEGQLAEAISFLAWRLELTNLQAIRWEYKKKKLGNLWGKIISINRGMAFNWAQGICRKMKGKGKKEEVA